MGLRRATSTEEPQRPQTSTPQPERDMTQLDLTQTITQAHAAEALGWLSAELAHRADAGNRHAPGWFPEPPEWLELWAQALAATATPEVVLTLSDADSDSRSHGASPAGDEADKLRELVLDWDRYTLTITDPAWRDEMRRATVIEMCASVGKLWRECQPHQEVE